MLNVGDIVLAKVTGISDFGFFVSIGNFKGLCHISEISNNFVEDIKKFVSVGDEIYVLILDIDDESKKVKVSIKDIYYFCHVVENIIKETRRITIFLLNERKERAYENFKSRKRKPEIHQIHRKFPRHGISPGFQRLADDCHGGVLHEQNECAPPPGCH